MDPRLRFFDATHLAPHLASVVEPFAALAERLARVPVRETDAALRKLLEAKDCAVRAAIEHREAAEAVVVALAERFPSLETDGLVDQLLEPSDEDEDEDEDEQAVGDLG